MPSSLEKFLQNIQQQIAEGDIELALEQLRSYVSAGAPNLQNETIMLSSRYKRLLRDERKGTITREVFQTDVNRLSQNVLTFLEELVQRVPQESSPIQSPNEEEPAEEVIIPDDVGLEKILGINNLKQIAWIEKGLKLSKSVCRILTPNGLGSGFLITPDLVMTNNHVLPNTDIASQAKIEFDYQLDSLEKPLQTSRYSLDVSRFHTNKTLDYTIVKVMPDPVKPPLEHWGYVQLNADADPVSGEHIIIIQHPNGGPKQIAMTANQVLNLWDHRLQYTTDTMPGSSGSPVLSDLWQVIAIHHAGGYLRTNSKGDKRFVNEGILMSAIKADAGDFWP